MQEKIKTKRQLPFIEESTFALNFEDKFRRFGFTSLILIIISALVGFFSSGYFSAKHDTIGNNGTHIEYEKFGRLMRDFTMTVTASEKDSTSYTLQLGDDFLQAFQVENIVPQPDKMYSMNNTLVLHYATSPARGELSTQLYLKPIVPGYVRTTISVNSQPETAISQLIYP